MFVDGYFSKAYIVNDLDVEGESELNWISNNNFGH